MDGSVDEGGGRSEAEDALCWHRLSGNLARLLSLRGKGGRHLRQYLARPALRLSTREGEARIEGRPARVVDGSTDGKRGEPAAAERVELSSSHLAAAVL